MPRSVEFSIDSSASVEQIHAAFSAEEYWQARLAAFGGLGRLDSLTVDTDGSVTIAIVHEVRDEGLPALVAKFFPHNWRVLQTETWSPICDGIMHGEVDIAAHGAPGSGIGMALLAPARRGSRLKCAATVEFKVPLVGGKFETIMGRSLAHQFSVIERFTSDWIAKTPEIGPLAT